MTISPADTLLSATPPLLVLLLLVLRGWSGARAGLAGWILALVLAILHFGAGARLLAYAHLRALVLTFDVVYIIWSALLLYLIVLEAGALARIANWFESLTEDAVLRVLLLGWVFASFLQGVGGFGVPIAVVAPLLVGLGVPPLNAVVIPSIGHSWSVTFGSLGTSFIALLGVTGADAAAVAPPTAILLGAAAFGCGALVAHAFGGWPALRRALPAVLVIGAVMAGTQYVLVQLDLWRLGATGAGLAGTLAALLWTRVLRPRSAGTRVLRPRSTQKPASDAATPDRPSLRLAIVGYAALVILALLVKGVPPISETLGSWRLSVALPAVTTARGWEAAATDSLGVALLSHPGSILLASALLAAFLYRRSGWLPAGHGRALLSGTYQRWRRSALGILTMMMMALVMANAGMTRALAEGLSQAVPAELYGFVATLIGAIGAFMTGSNTNSNAVFGALQRDTALLLGLSVPWVLALQTASGALSSMLAPAKILVGMSTVGIRPGDTAGAEGQALRHLLKYGGLLLLGITLIAYALGRLSPG